MTTIEQARQYINMMNASVSTVSSMGSFVSYESRRSADLMIQEIIGYLPTDTLAYKIATSTDRFSEKQLWVIAYELVKNAEFVAMVSEFYAEIASKEAARKARGEAKKAENKAASADAVSIVKSAGKKLGDYYTWLKNNRKFAREFWSKKYSVESATEFAAI